jgi:hypothetical protein
VLLPHQGIGWQAHVGGLVGGILSGWLFRDRRAARAVKPARGTAVSGAAGTAVLPAGERLAAPGAQATKKGGGSGKGAVVDPSNPRAELYKQLDDLGL